MDFPQTLDPCAECGLDIDEELPRVVSRVLGYSWHVICTPPLAEEERRGKHKRVPRRMVGPNKYGKAAK